MQKITPFLWFDGQAEEAAKFYVAVFKNSKILNVSRYGEAGPGPKGSVMTVEFQLEGQELYLGGSRRAQPLPRDLSGHVAHPFRSIHRAERRAAVQVQ
jgi:predicted 3-demethylubiquinone-9 3-methyltransferase (glyoxalase superfamily)